MDKSVALTRRRFLASACALGAGLGLSGTSTMAFLEDEETSEHNAVTAGELDLQLGWITHYCGARVETDASRPTNDPGPVFDLPDVKPGDSGGGVITLHVDGNPAYVWAELDVADAENEVTEPESDAGGEGGPSAGRGNGSPTSELATRVQTLTKPVGYFPDDGRKDLLKAEQRRFVRGACLDPGRFDEADCHFVGSLADLAASTNGHLLDGTPSDGEPAERSPFLVNSTYLLGFVWWIPRDVGNEVQGDSITFDLNFGAMQSRHLDDPEKHSPFADSLSA